MKPRQFSIFNFQFSRKTGVSTKQVGGFTLIELMLVIVVIGTLSVAAVGLFFQSLRGGGKAQSVKELEEGAQLTLNVMERHIRNARKIIEVGGLPCPGTGSSLTITGPDGGQTTFSLIDGQIASNSSALSPQSSVISDLSFSCSRQEGAPDQLIVSFTAESFSGEQVVDERDYSVTVGLRNY